MKELIKHEIGLAFMVMFLYVLMRIVSLLPYSDAIKGAICFVVLLLCAVGEIAIDAIRHRRRGNGLTDFLK